MELLLSFGKELHSHPFTLFLGFFAVKPDIFAGVLGLRMRGHRRKTFSQPRSEALLCLILRGQFKVGHRRRLEVFCPNDHAVL